MGRVISHRVHVRIILKGQRMKEFTHRLFIIIEFLSRSKNISIRSGEKKIRNHKPQFLDLMIIHAYMVVGVYRDNNS